MQTQLKPETRTANSMDADFAIKQGLAKRDGRRFEVEVGNQWGWFFTNVEATEFRQRMISRASKNKTALKVNEIREVAQ